MGAKPIFAFSFPRLPLLKALAALATAAAFSSCISDGANRTGAEYLAENGVLLKDSLYHVTLDNIPVDTFWTTEAEASHFTDSTILVGHAGYFTAEGQVAFHISDTATLGKMDTSDASTLKLSLGMPHWIAGGSALLASVAKDSAHPLDSIPFEVLTWEKGNQGVDDDRWNDTIAAWNNRYLMRNDTLPLMDLSRLIRDTVFLRYRTAYSNNTPQARPLRNLHKALSQSKGFKHVLEMRLARISLSPADTGDAMFRFGGYSGSSEAALAYGPLLLFGKYDSAVGIPTANRVTPIFVNNSTAYKTMVNYFLKYTGPENAMVTGKQRGLHVILNRVALLDSIDAALTRQNRPLQPRSASGDFDLSYFVPFARISLPLDTTQSRFEGGYPLIFRMVTNTDSLLGNEAIGSIRADTISKGAAKILFRTYEVAHPGTIHDYVSLSYGEVPLRPNDSLRAVILKYSVDSVRNDTTFIRVGETKQRNIALVGYGANRMILEFTASAESVVVRSYLSSNRADENNEFRDPETGETITDLEKRLPRFLRPGQGELTLRATGGFQRLLNRKASNTSILQDFLFQPAPLPAVDPNRVSGTDTAAQSVQYPILSVVAPDTQGNKLKVSVDLYLFPLKAR